MRLRTESGATPSTWSISRNDWTASSTAELQVSCSLVVDRGKLEAAGAPRRLPDEVTSDGPTGDVRDAKHTTIGEKEESGE